MLITTDNEIKSLMPTAKWDRPQQLFGYIEEEEMVSLEPLLGATLYQYVLEEYDRLRGLYGDITATTMRPTGKAKADPKLAHADVTERLEQIQQGKYREIWSPPTEGEKEVPAEDLKTVRLIRICQQIEFYRMLSHKAGMLTVSFNEGGGMNTVSAEGYEPADDKRIERMAKDAYMSAGRSTDTLLIFLEADAKGDKTYTEKWQDADAFYLHKDLLFQTAKALNEYLDIKGERMTYIQLVRDIRFCQKTYLKTRIGASLLQEVVKYANEGASEKSPETPYIAELLEMLRTALAFYVEARRVSVSGVSVLAGSNSRGNGTYQKEEKMARRDSMTDAQQAMAAACAYIEEHINDLGGAVVGTPIYNNVRAREAQEAQDKADACAAEERRRKAACQQNRKMMFDAFPPTHLRPERK